MFRNLVCVLLLFYTYTVNSAPVGNSGGGFKELKGWTKTLTSTHIKQKKIPVLTYWIEEECCGELCEKKCGRVKLQIRYRYKGEKKTKVVGSKLIPGTTKIDKVNVNEPLVVKKDGSQEQK